MADTDATTTTPTFPMPSLEDLQHWTWVMGRAQQMMMEFASKAGADVPADAAPVTPMAGAFAFPGMPDPAAIAKAQTDFWADSMKLWTSFLDPKAERPEQTPAEARDKRFKAPAWTEQPLFDLIRQSYQLVSRHMLRSIDAIEGLDDKQREQLRFNARGFIDAMSPSNFALTNPQVIERMIETRGESLLKGMQNMLADLGKGQLTHTDPNAFELGRNIAVTPGKVVHETPLYQLIQYTPTTETVLGAPLLIFPPWINRFYILDLNAEKSFIRWAVEQGITVFVVSWRSADAEMKDVVWDDYVAAQIDAIDTVRDVLDVPAVHAIGYCVAGTTLAATLAVLEAQGQAEKVTSATFFTAQVDFTQAGELNHFVDDSQLAMIEALSQQGFLDGRYMAATFNLLRGRDLIWNYVTSNYLMGEDYPAFDLLHWNGDTTNLPAKWHRNYLIDLYRDNRLAQPGSLSVLGVPLDLTTVKTPAYVQAGREDHIAPAESVWKITDHFSGPLRFVLAGSGHIAGVVNPPAAGKYQYWTNDAKVGSLEEFVAGATETRGSWWPDWLAWLQQFGDKRVDASGARVPGEGKVKAIEDAPGRYVRTR